MGQNKQNLSENFLNPLSIFPNRAVVECDETIHLHWRNLRLEMSDEDFLAFCDMVLKSYSSYLMNKHKTNEGQHIELSKCAIKNPIQPTRLKIDEQVNLYKILQYPDAEFYKEDTFIVIRLRDLRIEMGIEEFNTFYQTMSKAHDKLTTDI